MEQKELNEKQAEQVTGGDHYSNSEIKNHVNETMKFTAYHTGKEANVVLEKVDFTEHWDGNDCMVYLIPVSEDDADIMEWYCNEYPSVIFRNYYGIKKYKAYYDIWHATYLYK